MFQESLRNKPLICITIGYWMGNLWRCRSVNFMTGSPRFSVNHSHFYQRHFYWAGKNTKTSTLETFVTKLFLIVALQDLVFLTKLIHIWGQELLFLTSKWSIKPSQMLGSGLKRKTFRNLIILVKKLKWKLKIKAFMDFNSIFAMLFSLKFFNLILLVHFKRSLGKVIR